MVANIITRWAWGKINAFRFAFKMVVMAKSFIIAKGQIPILITKKQFSDYRLRDIISRNNGKRLYLHWAPVNRRRRGAHSHDDEGFQLWTMPQVQIEPVNFESHAGEPWEKNSVHRLISATGLFISTVRVIDTRLPCVVGEYVVKLSRIPGLIKWKSHRR